MNAPTNNKRRLLRVGSLCSGYGGLDLAVSAVLPTRLLWVADNDPTAPKVLAARYPHAANLGDIRNVDWATVPRVDLVTCGFPCQDISNAGPRTGIHGPRSGLWQHITAALRALSPPLAFVENMAALRVRGLDVVQADLAALGYGTRWLCLRASTVGAPHHRDRMFLLAHTPGALASIRTKR